MKKLATYYLLLLYTASVCKPFAIWFSDALAHAYFNHQHLATVHRHGGKNHVHQQISKAAKEEAPAQKQSATKAHDETAFAAPACYNFKRTTAAIIKACYNPNRSSLPAIFLAVQIPPPRA